MEWEIKDYASLGEDGGSHRSPKCLWVFGKCPKSVGTARGRTGGGENIIQYITGREIQIQILSNFGFLVMFYRS